MNGLQTLAQSVLFQCKSQYTLDVSNVDPSVDFFLGIWLLGI
jgi:hypothetical protein